MTKTAKTILIIALSVLMAALVLYCAIFGSSPETVRTESGTLSSDDPLQTAKLLSDAAEKALLEGTAKKITLSDDENTASVPGVQIRDGTVTVTTSGIYSVSGSLSEGQLAALCDGTVIFILDGVDISDSSDAAICISDADHAMIYLPEGSENRLTSGAGREITASEDNTGSGAALYARDSLSIAGKGSLSVGGYINNAVATTDDLVVMGGTLELTAANNGLKGKDSVTVLDGTINIKSGNDGIKSDNASDSNAGNIDIRGGLINIVSFGDGVQAERDISISGGVIEVSAGETQNMGGVNVTNAHAPDEAPPEKPDSDMGEEPPHGEMMQNTERRTEPPSERYGQREEADAASGMAQSRGTGASSDSKGIKSGGSLNISDGTVTVTSNDDCIHANGSISISGGTLVLNSGDDGLHADDTLTVSGGDITVSRSNEGIEGCQICITGGNISVSASDDGMNASGDGTAPLLKISGGTVYVNADGDGLDSNGDLIVEGGTVIVDGPTNGGNGALDSGRENGGSMLCNGGTVIAVGASGMAESFEGDSAQCAFILNYSETLPAGTHITVTDENGDVIFEHTSAKSFSSIVFSSPELIKGKTYTVAAGNRSDTVLAGTDSNGDPRGAGLPGDFGGGKKEYKKKPGPA